jgi:hypothetical protein
MDAVVSVDSVNSANLRNHMIAIISSDAEPSCSTLLCLGAPGILADLTRADTIAGRYLEVRSCDVYTGYCFANGEMGLAGKEGMMVWTIERGGWAGVDLAGLSVIAVIRTDQTLGDVQWQPREGRSVVITDARGTSSQQEALVAFARAMAGPLTARVEAVKSAPIRASIGACDSKGGCADVSAPGLVEISTRCLGDADHVCGNEAAYYPPLIRLEHPMPAFSQVAAYRGDALDITWEGRDQRNVFLGRFVR